MSRATKKAERAHARRRPLTPEQQAATGHPYSRDMDEASRIYQERLATWSAANPLGGPPVRRDISPCPSCGAFFFHSELCPTPGETDPTHEGESDWPCCRFYPEGHTDDCRTRGGI